MITMKKKIISGSLVALMALGLAGCANNSAAPSSKVNHPQTTKLAQSSNKKAANSSSAKAVSENSAVQSTTASASSQAVNAQATSVNTKASYAGQASAYRNDPSSDVVNQFIKASGVDNARGTQYMIGQADAQGEYQVEVRDSNGDPNISHLDGMYKFNPTTNQVQSMNPITGEYEK